MYPQEISEAIRTISRKWRTKSSNVSTVYRKFLRQQTSYTNPVNLLIFCYTKILLVNHQSHINLVVRIIVPPTLVNVRGKLRNKPVVTKIIKIISQQYILVSVFNIRSFNISKTRERDKLSLSSGLKALKDLQLFKIFYRFFKQLDFNNLLHIL